MVSPRTKARNRSRFYLASAQEGKNERKHTAARQGANLGKVDWEKSILHFLECPVPENAHCKRASHDHISLRLSTRGIQCEHGYSPPGSGAGASCNRHMMVKSEAAFSTRFVRFPVNRSIGQSHGSDFKFLHLVC
jgi:hypothetical protein